MRKAPLFFIENPGTLKFNYQRTMSDRQVLFACKFLRNRGPSRTIFFANYGGESPNLEYYEKILYKSETFMLFILFCK